MDNHVKLLRVTMWALVVLFVLFFIALIMIEHQRYSFGDESIKTAVETYRLFQNTYIS